MAMITISFCNDIPSYVKLANESTLTLEIHQLIGSLLKSNIIT